MNSNRNLMARPSGIRPPSSYKSTSGIPRGVAYRPSEAASASSRKGPLSSLQYNAVSSIKSKYGSSSSVRPSNGFAIRKMSFGSAKKSMTGKFNIFGMTPQHTRGSFMPGSGKSSLCPSSAIRRGSSIGGRQMVKDTRPLTDSTYQHQCVSKLLQFLTNHNYPHPISKTFYKGPSTTEVRNIFVFLYSFYDKELKTVDVVTQIPNLMSQLGYPYTIKRSDLTSFSGLRTLGIVFGMFDWLVDSLNYCLQMDTERLMGRQFDGEEPDIKAQLIQVALSNVDENLPEIDNNTMLKLQQLEKKHFGTENEYKMLIEEKEKLEEELQKIEESIEMCEDYPQMIESLKKDIENLKKYGQELSEYIMNKEEESEELLKLELNKEEEIKELKKKKKNLQTLISEQTFGIEQVQHANDRKQQLEMRIKDELQTIEQFKIDIRSVKNEHNKRMDDLEKLYGDAHSYIKFMSELTNLSCNEDSTRDLKTKAQDKFWHEMIDKLENANKNSNSIGLDDLKKFEEKLSGLKFAIVETLSQLKGSVNRRLKQDGKEKDSNIETLANKEKCLEAATKKLVEDLEIRKKEIETTLSQISEETNRYNRDLMEMTSNVNNKKNVQEEIDELIKRRDQTLKKFLEEKEKLKSENNSMIEEAIEKFRVILQRTENNNRSQKETNSKLKKLERKTRPRNATEKLSDSKENSDKPNTRLRRQKEIADGEEVKQEDNKNLKNKN